MRRLIPFAVLLFSGCETFNVSRAPLEDHDVKAHVFDLAPPTTQPADPGTPFWSELHDGGWLQWLGVE